MQASAARWLARWARPRAVEALPVRLDRRRVYVLPTRFGLFYAALVFTMALGALNYNNNPALLLALLLLGLALTGGALAQQAAAPGIARVQGVAADHQGHGHAQHQRHAGVVDRGEPPRAHGGARLHRALVYEQQVAADVSIDNTQNAQGGYFAPTVFLSQGKTPEQGEQALSRELAKLRDAPVSAAELEEAGLPYTIIGLGGMLYVPEVADVVAMLRMVADPTAGAAAMRVLTGPRWRLGGRDVTALWRRAVELASLTPAAFAALGHPRRVSSTMHAGARRRPRCASRLRSGARAPGPCLCWLAWWRAS